MLKYVSMRDRTVHRRLRTRESFTLVEMMIASAVFLIVSFGLIAGMLAAIRANSMASDHYKATCIARNRIQKARTMPFSTLTNGTLAETNYVVDEQGFACQTNEDSYTRSTIFTNVNSNAVDIIVQVYFPIGLGKMSPQPVSMQTKIYNGF